MACRCWRARCGPILTRWKRLVSASSCSTTPNFIAPEVIATPHLNRTDPAGKLPSTLTDRHALAVLIYMYLFYRHPLRGGAVHHTDAAKDEDLSTGSKALFVEHPTDAGNRIRTDHLSKTQLPWGDAGLMPGSIAGPLLAELFHKAFVDGLHTPPQRPTPSEWEAALVRTIDLIQPCTGDCEMGWYVFDNSTRPRCPLCHTPYTGALPVLNRYSSRHSGSYQPDNHGVMVWNGQSLFPWHVNRRVSPNEHLGAEQRRGIGYFQFHQGDWYLVNEGMSQMYDVAAQRDVAIGGNVKLANGSQLLLSREDGGRLIQVQLVNG